jgi:hypothetical protein
VKAGLALDDLTLRNLAVLAEARGDRPEAERLWQSALAECPGDHDAQAAVQRLGDSIWPKA